MKVYTAAPFAWRDRMRAYRDELAEVGVGCTARWLNEKASPTSSIFDHDDEYLRGTAYIDLEDIIESDAIVLFTPEEEDFKDMSVVKRAWARGGRHFEFGFAYGLHLLSFLVSGKTFPELIICGPRENVFSYLDGLKQFNTWSETKSYLAERGQLAKAAKECVREN